jgi:hypothetical protein
MELPYSDQLIYLLSFLSHIDLKELPQMREQQSKELLQPTNDTGKKMEKTDIMLLLSNLNEAVEIISLFFQVEKSRC